MKKGQYLIIKGDELILREYDISQRRIRIDNLHKYPQIGKYIDGKTIISDAFSEYIALAKGTAKAVDYLGVAGDIISIGIDTALEMNKFSEADDKAIVGAYTATTGVISAVASAAASAGAMALASKIGASLGTAIAPGLGTLIGLGAGFLTGAAIDFFFNFVKEEYIYDVV